MTWTPPPGFEPVLFQGEVEVGFAKLGKLVFDIGEGHEDAPALPLKEQDEAWQVGWDIPTRWAIDSRGQCYKDDGAGHSLRRCSPEHLLFDIRHEHERRRLQDILGLPVDEPSWMTTARANGWTAPSPKATAPTTPQTELEAHRHRRR